MAAHIECAPCKPCNTLTREPQLPCCSDAAIDASLPSVAIDSAVRQHAADGRPVYRIHAERLAALAPNVIITQSQCEVCAGAGYQIMHQPCGVLRCQPGQNT